MQLTEKLKKIKLVAMDVDGTMTDGKVYYSKNGEELKIFSIRDGMGIELLRKAGIEPMIITSETSEIVTARANKLKIQHVIQGSRNKKKDLEDFALSNNYELNSIGYIGDDVNDIQVMKICGVSACPKNSNEFVIEIVNYVCKEKSGNGAVREFIELILKAQNKSLTLPEIW